MKILARLKGSVVALRRIYLFVTCLLVGLFTVACASSGVERTEDIIGTGKMLKHGIEAGWIEMKLFYRNDSSIVETGASTSVIPVARSVPLDELTARAVLNALISGPLPGEQAQYDAGPVINGAELQIEDVYIKNDICVVHLLSPHPLPLHDYEEQSDIQAETVLAHSLLYSLTELPQVEAVWLFYNGEPWRGSNIDWICPLAPPGRGVGYTLYFCKDTVSHPTGCGADSLVQVRVRLISGERDGEDCLFKKIIDLLSWDYDLSHRAPLRVLGFSLIDHLLSIDFADPFVGSPGQVQGFVGALVYTFTGFPEIDAVKITIEGKPWECGGINWGHPLRADDFETIIDPCLFCY